MTTPPAQRTATQVVACGTPSDDTSPGPAAGAFADNPIRRSSSGKFAPGSFPGAKNGIAIYWPPFCT